MKISIMLIATTLVGFAAPAFADVGSGEQRMKLAYDAKHDKYCMSQEVTGTRLPVKDCRSKADWAKAGLVFPDQNEAKLAAK